jgi:hypothetical protein
MATPLSPEVWDIIVAQLPPPEPKLVPMIYMEPDYSMDGRIFISKAVSDKEAFMILDILHIVESDGDVLLNGTNDVYWCMVLADLRSARGEFEEYFVRARMLGWDYATDADRAAHAANKSFYMTRAK